MTWLRLALLPVLLYVLTDFASPQVAGAVSFEANDCVDGVRPERVRTATERPTIALDAAARTLERPASHAPPRPPGVAGPDRSRMGLARDPRYGAADRPSSPDAH